MIDKTLRVGFLIPHDRRLAAWQREVVDAVLRHANAEVVFFAYHADTPPRRPLMRRIANLLHQWRILWAVVDRMENALGRRLMHMPEVDGSTSLADLATTYPFLPVSAVRERGLYDRFTPESLAALRRERPDIIVRFAFNILRGEILSLPTYGVWSYHHGDNRVYRGTPPGFWEWYRGSTTTGVVLQKLNEDLDNGVVLSRRVHRTHLYSWNKNRAFIYKRSVSMVSDAITQLAAGALNTNPPDREPQVFLTAVYSGRLFTAPRAREALTAVGKWILRNLTRSQSQLRFSTPQWQILVANNPQQALSLRRYRRIIPPKHVFWADPFALRKSAAQNLAGAAMAVEEFEFDKNKGRIIVLSAGADGAWATTPIIDDHLHYSYPFVFSYDGRQWMVPECYQSNRIDIFRCDEFPLQWQRHATLIRDISAADTTIFQWNGRWWLFTNVNRYGSYGDYNTELFVFFADSPLSSNWQPHRLNPVLADVTQARSAGRPFEDSAGHLIRPVQDCGSHYGSRIRLYEITELSEDRFAQREISAIEPNWARDVESVHHLDYAPDFVVVDAQYRIARE